MYMGCKLMRGLPTGLFRKRVWGGWGQKDGRLESFREVVEFCFLTWEQCSWFTLVPSGMSCFPGKTEEEKNSSRARKEAESLLSCAPRAGGRQVPGRGDRRPQHKEP